MYFVMDRRRCQKIKIWLNRDLLALPAIIVFGTYQVFKARYSTGWPKKTSARADGKRIEEKKDRGEKGSKKKDRREKRSKGKRIEEKGSKRKKIESGNIFSPFRENPPNIRFTLYFVFWDIWRLLSRDEIKPRSRFGS